MTPRSRPGRLAAALVAGSLAVTAIAVVGAGAYDAGQADDPGFRSEPPTAPDTVTPAWAAAHTSLAAGIDPGSGRTCVAGSIDCLDAVVLEMTARRDVLDCDHAAPFAHMYTEMTIGVRNAVEAELFETGANTIQMDAIFAELYFQAIDNWTAGRTDEVPGAWQVAFQAAEDGRTSAATDLLLGMNAHISRDLAHTTALLADAPEGSLVNPDDFDLVNEVIDSVREPMLQGAAVRFDPSLAALDPDTLRSGDIDPALDLGPLAAAGSDLDAIALIALWRDQALAAGARLAAATTDEERADIAAEIERTSVATASLILNTDRLLTLGLPADERDAYCDSQSPGS